VAQRRFLGADVRHGETPGGIIRVERGTQLPPAAWNVADAAPVAVAFFEDRVDDVHRGAVAAFDDDTAVGVFDLGPPLFQLANRHPDTVHDIERLEAGNDHGHPIGRH